MFKPSELESILEAMAEMGTDWLVSTLMRKSRHFIKIFTSSSAELSDAIPLPSDLTLKIQKMSILVTREGSNSPFVPAGHVIITSYKAPYTFMPHIGL